jgi:predicted transcriptional regulator
VKSGEIVVERRTAVLVRLNPEDRAFVKRLAEYYDISEAGVLRMALREFIEKRKNENKSS